MNFLACPIVIGTLFSAFVESDIKGKLIVLILIATSAVIWSILVAKSFELKDRKKKSLLFMKKYRSLVSPVDLLGDSDGYKPSPLAAIYESTGEKLIQCLRRESQHGMSYLTEAELEAVRARSDREMADQILAVEKNIEEIIIR